MANPADVQPKEKESRLSAFPLLLSCLFLSLFTLSILFLTLFPRIRLGTERREYGDAHFNLVGMNKQWGFHVQDKFPLATHSHTLAQKHVLTYLQRNALSQIRLKTHGCAHWVIYRVSNVREDSPTHLTLLYK